MYYRDITKPSVEFRQETVESIDPATRHVVTSGGTYDADVLVVALGADLDPAATPGLLEGGYEFYTEEGAFALRDVLPTFDGGDVIISVLGPFFKCPAAPFEAAMMLHDLLAQRGEQDATTIKVLSPMPMPIPISPEASGAILAGLEERGIEFRPADGCDRARPGDEDRDPSRRERDLLRPVPRRSGAPRAGGGGGVRARSRRMDPG